MDGRWYCLRDVAGPVSLSVRIPQSCQNVDHPPNTESSLTTSLHSGTWGTGADAVAVVCLLALVYTTWTDTLRRIEAG